MIVHLQGGPRAGDFEYEGTVSTLRRSMTFGGSLYRFTSWDTSRQGVGRDAVPRYRHDPLTASDCQPQPASLLSWLL